MLENLAVMDKEKEQEKIKKCIDENFKTNTGRKSIILRPVFLRIYGNSNLLFSTSPPAPGGLHSAYAVTLSP